MAYSQSITPTPNIPCKPGWCLEYVNNAFGVPVRYGSATAAWNGSTTKHLDMDFPVGVFVPLWFSLEHEPNGHVALMTPDGSVYSTSDPYGYTPHHHPNLADLIHTYSRNNPLTFLGWTEDVEGTTVIAPATIQPQSIEGIIMAMSSEQQDQLFTWVKDLWWQQCSVEGRAALDQRVGDAVLERPIAREGEGKAIPGDTSLRAVVASTDDHTIRLLNK